MNIENPIPSGGSVQAGEKIPKPLVPPHELKKWQDSIAKGFDDAAFQYSVSQYESEQREKRTSDHITTASSSQFVADAGKVIEEEAIKNLNKPITQTPLEPAGQVSVDAANLEPSKA